MRIGFCTWEDPSNKRSWSGGQYFMFKALQKHCGDVIALGPIPNRCISFLNILFERVINKFTKRLFKKEFKFFYAPVISRGYGRILKKRLENEKLDILIFLGEGVLLCDLDCNIPSIYISDVTAKLVVDYYPDFKNQFSITKKWYLRVYEKTVDKADIIALCSKWAAESVIKDYDCGRDRVYITHAGANLESIPSKEEIMLHRRDTDKTLKLIFMGNDWQRKRGELAFKTMVELNNRGIDTELTVVSGTKIPDNIRHEKLKLTGFLDRDNEKQALKLHNLFLKSSILLSPTQCEAFGFAFCEAAAYGLPAVGTDTGGVSDYVDNEITGYLLPVEADFKSYADIIQNIWSDKDRYLNMCKHARAKFENDLNWDSWGKRMNQIINDNCPNRK